MARGSRRRRFAFQHFSSPQHDGGGDESCFPPFMRSAVSCGNSFSFSLPPSQICLMEWNRFDKEERNAADGRRGIRGRPPRPRRRRRRTCSSRPRCGLKSLSFRAAAASHSVLGTGLASWPRADCPTGRHTGVIHRRWRRHSARGDPLGTPAKKGVKVGPPSLLPTPSCPRTVEAMRGP